jgi:hypothetical protein
MRALLLGIGRIRHRHVNDRVALILRLVIGSAATVVGVTRIGIRRATSRKSIISRSIGDGRSPGSCGADRDSGAKRIIAPAVPIAAPIAVVVPDIDVAGIDVAVVDVVSAAAARTIARPASTASPTNSANASRTPRAANSANAAGATGAPDSTDAAGTTGTANSANASGAAGTADASNAAWSRRRPVISAAAPGAAVAATSAKA